MPVQRTMFIDVYRPLCREIRHYAARPSVAEPLTKVGSGMRLYGVAAVYAAWLFSIFAVFYLMHGDEESVQQLQFVLIGGIIPATCQILFLGIDWRGLVAPVKIWVALLLVILLSYVAGWSTLVYFGDVVITTAIGTLIAGCPDRRLLRSIAGLYCAFALPFLVYVDLTGQTVWGRLAANNINPTNWGLMGLTVCLAAFARKLGVIAVSGFAVGAVTILEASSREHLLALAVVLLVIAALQFRELNRYRLMAVVAGSCIISVAAAILLDPYILEAIRYISSDILLLHSTDRGIDSGFSGRTGVWVSTIDIWLKSPLTGVGFRQHERFLPDLAAGHNAYLAMLADTGVLGFIVYLVLLVGSLVAAWGIRDQRTGRFAVAIIVGYWVIGFFDRRAINSGNPYSLFFLICCSVALADRSLRKTAELYFKLVGGASNASDRQLKSVNLRYPLRPRGSQEGDLSPQN